MLTMTEILAEMPEGDAKMHWESCPDFPINALAPEALSILLTSASIAAAKKNVGLDPGQQIAAFPAPTYGGVSLDPATGVESHPKTVSVVTRNPSDSNLAVGDIQ
ncbi:MAG: hypothetical protein AAGA60_10735 [Cyanobacteria bacterium P01_E01_bin.42]